MAEYVVPKGCYGLTMEDGTKYNADRSGRIKDVTNANHQYHIERNSSIGGGHIHRSTGNMPSKNSASMYCRGCKFVGYGWQKVCPKCGEKMEKETRR
jgi:hypothetical protein